MDNEQVLALWRERVVCRGKELDEEADREGHDWHSLWTGFVIALDRPDLSDWSTYMDLAFPVELDVGLHPEQHGNVSRFHKHD